MPMSSPRDAASTAIAGEQPGRRGRSRIVENAVDILRRRASTSARAVTTGAQAARRRAELAAATPAHARLSRHAISTLRR